MAEKIQTIINLVEQLAPKYLAETWDNVGLQLGDPGGEVQKVLVSLDINLEVVEEAIREDVDLIVCHHPLIFQPLKSIRFDHPLGKLITQLIGNSIAVYAAHTNLDSANEGINQLLAEKLGLQNTEVLAPSSEEKYHKLVVFVPQGHQDQVRKALAQAGAGWIGNYSHCSFQTAGTGTFLAGVGAKPFMGQVGELEKAEEYRLETILPARLTGKVIKAMLKAHPYEEVAYDLYPLLNEGPKLGLGRIGKLAVPLTLAELIQQIKEQLELSSVRFGGDPARKIEKVALCGGSGASLIGKAVFKGADVLLTGDIKYHEGQDMLAQGLSFIDAGHHGTEQIIVPVLAAYLRTKAATAKLAIEVVESQVNTNPFQMA